MNNIYHHFVHLSGHADFKTLPAPLRLTRSAP